MEFGQLEARKLQNPAEMQVRYSGRDLKEQCRKCNEITFCGKIIYSWSRPKLSG